MTQKDPLDNQGEGASARRSWLLGAVAGAASIVDADWCDAEALMGPPFLVGLTAS